MMKLPFTLPALGPKAEIPTRIKGGFLIGDKSVPVLEYSSNLQGWSDELTEFHEEIAGDEHPIDQASRADALRQVSQYTQEKSPIILEVGCSSGFMLRTLQTAAPHAVLMGADIVSAPLTKLAQDMPNVSCFRFDLVQCPLPDNCVDIVIILNILEHIEDDNKALQQIYRILKPGGIAIIEVPAGPHLYDAYDQQLKHYRRYSLSMLCARVKTQGFAVKRSSHLGFFVYPMFSLVKKYNKRFLKSDEAIQKKTVEKNIRSTSNVFIKTLMKIELFLGNYISYPIGIRNLVTCMKPKETSL